MKRKKADKDDNCIVHFGDLDDDSFIYLKDLKDAAGRLQFLQTVKQRRLAEPENSSRRYTTACNLIPDEVTENAGYHPSCYKKFTRKYEIFFIIKLITLF